VLREGIYSIGDTKRDLQYWSPEHTSREDLWYWSLVCRLKTKKTGKMDIKV
jgi:hypothetical protein